VCNPDEDDNCSPVTVDPDKILKVKAECRENKLWFDSSSVVCVEFIDCDEKSEDELVKKNNYWKLNR